MRVILGSIVRDVVTGFTGVAVSRTEWLHGCVRVGVQPRELHEGKPIESSVFDEAALEVVSETFPQLRQPDEGGFRTTGGDRPDPSPRVDPGRS